MRRQLKNVVGASAVSFSLAVLSFILPAAAQNNAPGVNTNPDTTTLENNANDDDGFDWGWLGLLGLIGLAGLAGKRNEPTRYRDPNAGVGTTTYRE
jgi:hypothetical protein